MTTDITELAQSLKAAANTTADAIDRLKAFPGDELIDLSQHQGEQVDIDITTLNEWYELSSPANILALVEALEKAQQRIAELEREQEHLRPVGVMSEKAFHRLENSECRFIALWPRPGIFLPRKRPEDGVIVYALTVAAAGIKVEAE